MTTIFPKNNLPEPAQPWAREVQKQLANVIASDRANEINNAARDNQLNSSLITLSKTVSDVKTVATQAAQAAADAEDAATTANNAINGLTGLGTSSGSLYNINANNITAGNIVSGSSVAAISLLSQDGTGFVQAWNGNARMRGGNATVQCNDVSIILAGQVTATSRVYMPSLSTDSSAANMRVGTGGAGEVFRSTASSRNFKNSIIPINEELQLDPKKLLEIPVVAFKYNEDYLRSDDIRFNKMIPGFIAEDMKEIYEIAVEQDGGDATDWNPRYIIPGMLALIQELYERIEVLESKVE